MYGWVRPERKLLTYLQAVNKADSAKGTERTRARPGARNVKQGLVENHVQHMTGSIVSFQWGADYY